MPNNDIKVAFLTQKQIAQICVFKYMRPDPVFKHDKVEGYIACFGLSLLHLELKIKLLLILVSHIIIKYPDENFNLITEKPCLVYQVFPIEESSLQGKGR